MLFSLDLIPCKLLAISGWKGGSVVRALRPGSAPSTHMVAHGCLHASARGLMQCSVLCRHMHVVHTHTKKMLIKLKKSLHCSYKIYKIL